MKKIIRYGVVILMVMSLGGVAFGQFEKEPINQYRATSDFEMPAVESREGVSGGIRNEEPIAMDISPENFGLTYIAPPELWALLDIHLRQNDALKEADGFRIQIYAGSSLESANDAKADFIMSFDDEKFAIYQMWNPPHFRVRIGDFLSRNAAMREVASIREIFPDAFIVSDRVKLLRYKERRTLPELPEGEETKAERPMDDMRQN